ncbi:TRAP transporter small permease [Sneathiella limimaris]|uniref:TRAP transporter small permease n=1 Tax=Sneathiella limimaris TaxID=1964213 RepID=UPI00146AF8F7|nr:TRAP transporter small permease [Sneathiella limimaris]
MKNFMMAFARFMAYLGGLVLSFLVVLTCLSILGRLMNGGLHSDFMQSIAPGFSNWLIEVGIGPINGDFELVEAGVAFAIFAFIPICQLTAGHAVVDLFTNQLPERANRFLQVLIEFLFAAVLVLIAWRLFDGLLSKQRYGETTFLLQFPIWWAYLASFIGAVSSAVVGVYVAYIRLIEFITNREVLIDPVESEL